MPSCVTTVFLLGFMTLATAILVIPGGETVLLSGSTTDYKNLVAYPSGIVNATGTLGISLQMNQYDAGTQSLGVSVTFNVSLVVPLAMYQIDSRVSQGNCGGNAGVFVLAIEPATMHSEIIVDHTIDVDLACNRLYSFSLNVRASNLDDHRQLALVDSSTVISHAQAFPGYPCFPLEVRCPNFDDFVTPAPPPAMYDLVGLRRSPPPHNLDDVNIARDDAFPSDIDEFSASLSMSMTQIDTLVGVSDVVLTTRRENVTFPPTQSSPLQFSIGMDTNACGLRSFLRRQGRHDTFPEEIELHAIFSHDTCDQELYLGFKLDAFFDSTPAHYALVDNFRGEFGIVTGFGGQVCIRLPLQCTTPAGLIDGGILEFGSTNINASRYNLASVDSRRRDDIDFTAISRMDPIGQLPTGGMRLQFALRYNISVAPEAGTGAFLVSTTFSQTLCGATESSPNFIFKQMREVDDPAHTTSTPSGEFSYDTTLNLPPALCGQLLQIQTIVSRSGGEEPHDLWDYALTFGQATVHGVQQTVGLCVQYRVNCNDGTPIPPPPVVPPTGPPNGSPGGSPVGSSDFDVGLILWSTLIGSTVVLLLSLLVLFGCRSGYPNPKRR